MRLSSSSDNPRAAITSTFGMSPGSWRTLPAITFASLATPEAGSLESLAVRKRVTSRLKRWLARRGYRQIWAAPTRSVRLECKLEAPIRHDQVRH